MTVQAEVTVQAELTVQAERVASLLLTLWTCSGV
jgi:hypothetical protein